MLRSLMLLALLIGVQQDKPAPPETPKFVANYAITTPTPTVEEVITVDNHYRLTFDDPTNQWRCVEISGWNGEPLTVVCSKPHAIRLAGETK